MNKHTPYYFFLFDTTGSMRSSIASVQTAAKKILNQLDTLGADYRIAVADYKDFPEQSGYPYRADLPFCTDKTAITNSINSLSLILGAVVIFQKRLILA